MSIVIEEKREDRSIRELEELRREIDRQRIDVDKFKQEQERLRENAEYWRNRAINASKNTYASGREVKSEEKVCEEPVSLEKRECRELCEAVQ